MNVNGAKLGFGGFGAGVASIDWANATEPVIASAATTDTINRFVTRVPFHRGCKGRRPLVFSSLTY
jgi:hypothetical protein